MAELKQPLLDFPRGCPDPGRRGVNLPAPLPDIGVDFDWHLRDYESFRSAMLEDLITRFPERRRWTTADLEVVLIEAFAAILDQFSDMIDRVAAESYLQTARRPENVYNWLRFIGMDINELYPVEELHSKKKELELKLSEILQLPISEEVDVNNNLINQKDVLLEELNELNTLLSSTKNIEKDLFRLWHENPYLMDAKRRLGPASIRKQKRMTSLTDYAVMLEEHPLVERAYASRDWGGSWLVVWIMLSLWNNLKLDNSPIADSEHQLPDSLKRATDNFHRERGLRMPKWSTQETLRDILRSYIQGYRSIGQEVFLEDIVPVGIDILLCLQVGQNYYQSEVIREAQRLLGRGPGGFFEPGRLKVGEDLHMSDFYERLMNLDGISNVEVITFKKVGSLYLNRADSGLIVMKPKELAVCDNDSFQRERGVFSFKFQGGRRG